MESWKFKSHCAQKLMLRLHQLARLSSTRNVYEQPENGGVGEEAPAATTQMTMSDQTKPDDHDDDVQPASETSSSPQAAAKNDDDDDDGGISTIAMPPISRKSSIAAYNLGDRLLI